MAKFTGKSMTLTFGGNTITCLQSVETSEAADVAMIECAGATAKEKVIGLTDAKMTVNLALNTNDNTLLGYFDIGDVGAVVFQPAGATAGNMKWTSTNGTCVSRTTSTAVNAFGAATFTLELDDLTHTTV